MKKIIVSIIVIGLLSTIPMASVNAYNIEETSGEVSLNCYGFIITVDPNQSGYMQMNISKLLNELLGKNILIYWITSNISVLSMKLNDENIASRTILKGSYIVPFIGDPSLDLVMTNTIYRYNSSNNIEILRLMEPLSNLEVYRLNEPRIAYHSGNVSSIGWSSYYCLLERCGFRHHRVLEWNVIPDKLNNNDFNVFIWGGNDRRDDYLTLKGIAKYPEAIQTIREFVSNGGGYVGSCYGGDAIALGSYFPWSWMKPWIPKLPSWMFLGFSSRLLFPRALPGYGRVEIHITDSDCPIAFGLPEVIQSVYMGGPLFLGRPGNTRTIAILNKIAYGEDGNGWTNLTEIPEDFRAIWINFALNKPVWVTTKFGNGKVVAFSDHPEYNIPILNPELDNNRIVTNAIFYAASEGPYNIDIHNSISLSELDFYLNGSHEVPNVYIPHNKPMAPDGFNTGETGKIYYFLIRINLSDVGTNYNLIFDMGNGETEPLFFDSWPQIDYDTTWFLYSWNETGEYAIRVRIVHEDGSLSPWSNPLIINISSSDDNDNSQSQPQSNPQSNSSPQNQPNGQPQNLIRLLRFALVTKISLSNAILQNMQTTSNSGKSSSLDISSFIRSYHNDVSTTTTVTDTSSASDTASKTIDSDTSDTKTTTDTGSDTEKPSIILDNKQSSSNQNAETTK